MTAMIALAKSLFLILSALLPIVDPLGGSPIFLTLTSAYPPASRRLLSRRIAIDSFFLLLGAFFIGTHVLAFFGISLPVVQIGGGMIVISTGWTLLKQRPNENAQIRQSVQPHDLLSEAFYPLTMPLTVGPGSISVAITLGANAAHHGSFNILEMAAAVIGSAILGIAIYLCYGFAERIAQLLGATAMSVVMQLSSFLLVCIGVQILWNGLNVLLLSVASSAR